MNKQIRTEHYPEYAWEDIKKKIVFSVMYNRAVKNLNDWCGKDVGLFENELKTLERKGKNVISKELAAERTQTAKTLIDTYPYAVFFDKWNLEKSIIAFGGYLCHQRNFFSHGYHQPIKWQHDEQNALQKLYEKIAEVNTKVHTDKYLTKALFYQGNPQTAGVLTFQGALFFVSLFLTGQEANEMFDSLEQFTDTFYRQEKAEGAKTYQLLDYYAGRDVYVFWSKRTNASLIPDNLETKRFYDIVNYLRKCPQLSESFASDDLKDAYTVRSNDSFLRFASGYLTRIGAFKRLAFQSNAKEREAAIHDNNIDFRIYANADGMGYYVKGYMGKDVLQRIMVQLLGNTTTGVEIENDIEAFINTYHTIPVATINQNTHPLPDKVVKRQFATTEEEMVTVLDNALIKRLEWVIDKLESEEPIHKNASAKADYIAERWNRWNMFQAMLHPQTGITSFPQYQFVKIRALLTNYKKNKRAIIEELKNSNRYWGLLEDINKEAIDLEDLYTITRAEDLKFCTHFLKDATKRVRDYDGLAQYLNLKNPFAGSEHVTQFDNKMPMPINKKLFMGKSNFTAPHIIELIEEYYPIDAKRYSADGERIADSTQRQREHRINKSLWKLKQSDEVLAAIAVKYLEKVLQEQSKSIAIEKFSLENLEDELATLNLRLTFTITQTNGTATKKVAFTFEEYKVAQNRMILYSLKDLAFLSKFDAKQVLLFSDLQLELESYLSSQQLFIGKVLELERKIFNDNPSLKAHPKAQKNGYLSFAEFIKNNNVPNLKYHLDNYLNDKQMPFVNKSTPNYEQEFVKGFRNNAMHNNVPVVNGILSEEFFKPAIDFLTYYLEKERGR